MEDEFNRSFDSVVKQNPLSRQRESIKYAGKMQIADILEIQKYLNDIEKYPLLTPDEEAYLFSLYQLGDEKAFEKVIQSNLRFVIYVAKNFIGCGVPLADLIQEGNIGLVEAGKRFDHTRGFKFISYASYSIIQKILGAISKTSSFSGIPTGSIKKMSKFVENFLQENERFPSDSELKDFCKDNDIDPLFIKYYLGHTDDFELIPLNHTSSEYKQMGINPDLLKNIYNDSVSSDSYADMIPNGCENEVIKPLNDEDVQKIISSLLNRLTEYESTIIKMVYGIGCNPMTLDEIGLRFNITRERVRQIKEKGFKRLENLIKYRYGRMYECIINSIDINLRKKEDDEKSDGKY